MNTTCNKEWTRQFMSRAFTSEFMNKRYVKHREEILFEQEKALLPETQPAVARIIYRRNEMARIETESAEIARQMDILDIRLNRLNRHRTNLLQDTFEIDENDEAVDDGVKDEDDSKNKKMFCRKCTNENCKGFLSSKWKCSLCETWTCHECHVNVGTFENKQTHVCLKEDVETVKLLKTDSKQCPSCSVLIFKMYGCDQMFCTNCKTAFSWNTGKIYHGRQIHNPHYFEYMRENGNANANANANPNGDNIRDGCRQLDGYIAERIHVYLAAIDTKIKMLTLYNHKKTIVNLDTVSSDNTSSIYNICRNIIHLKNVIIVEHERIITRCTDYSVSNRIDYLLNMMDETKFKKNIQMNEKKKQKSQEYLAILTMVCDTVTDTMHNLHITLTTALREVSIDPNQSLNFIANSLTSSKINCLNQKMELNNCDIERIMFEFQNLIQYANNCLNNISHAYKCVNKQFTSTFELKKLVDEITAITSVVDLTGFVDENDM
jgi:hypothetical protein